MGVSSVPLYNGRAVVSAPMVLDAFAAYINSLSLPFSFDHAQGFLK